MKSHCAAGALLAAGIFCSAVHAGFPTSTLGPIAPNGFQQPSYQVAQVPGVNYGPLPQASCANGRCPTGPIYHGTPTPLPPSAVVPPSSGPVHHAPVYPSAPVYESNPYFQSMSGPWTPNPCDCPPPPVASCCPTWFGGVYGLIMTREDEETYYFGASDSDMSRLYLPSTELQADFTGGVEARIGRTFDCCRWGLEGVYRGINPDRQQAWVDGADVPGMFMSKVDYNRVYVNMVDPMGGFMPMPAENIGNDLQTMCIHLDTEFHNVEINFLSGPLLPANKGCCGGPRQGMCGVPCGPGGGGYGLGTPYGSGGGYGCVPVVPRRPRLSAGWLLGVRFFRFDERLCIGMDGFDTTINYPPNDEQEMFHKVDVENNLVGFQLGCNVDCCLTQCFSCDFGAKFGLYGNHVSHYQRILNANGPAYVMPSMPQDFTVRSSEDDVAFLGELRAGCGYKVGKHIRLTGGYRAVAASGVALTTDQMRHGRELAALWKVADVDTEGSLILHGAYAGCEFAW